MGYSEDDRVELVHTSDPYTDLSPGDRGTVTGTNTVSAAIGPGPTPTRKVHVDWDSGSSLSMVLGEDSIKKVTDDEDGGDGDD